MPKETVSLRQAACTFVMFLFGSSVIMGVNSEAGQDSWISLLLAMLMALPIILIYARIMRLYPEMDLFEIVEKIIGKIGGKIVTILMIWYALHLCALVIRDFSEFIKVTVLTETPQLNIMLILILVVVYMSKSGIETMGKWSVIILPVITLVVIFTMILGLERIDPTNLLPIMGHSLGTIAGGAYKIFAFPFAETVVFLCLAGSLRKKDSPYKLFTVATLIATVIFLLVIMRNLLLLGPAVTNAKYYPSYTAVRIINVGDFLVRIEGSTALNFILAGVIKTTVCLVAASKGITRLFGLCNYKHIVFPLGLLAVALGTLLYENIKEAFDFLEIYQIYAIPFQIIIPVFIWILAEIKVRQDKAANGSHSPDSAQTDAAG